MECEEVRERLEALSTGELGLAERGPVERHLEACEPCRRAFVRLRSLAALLRGVPVPPVPEGFAARVAAGRAAAGSSWNFFRALAVRRVAAAILFAAGGLLAGTVMGWQAGGARVGDRVRSGGVVDLIPADLLGDVPESSMVHAFWSPAVAPAGGRRSP